MEGDAQVLECSICFNDLAYAMDLFFSCIPQPQCLTLAIVQLCITCFFVQPQRLYELLLIILILHTNYYIVCKCTQLKWGGRDP